ncbi:MAG: MFS transporter, partial [Spirochaetae bacterium HGW-Spirochaetae-9]
AAIMFVNNNIAPERRAVGMALYTSVGIGLPTVVGAGIGGYVVEWIGFGRMFGSYTVLAILSLVMIFLFRKVLLKRAVASSGT